MADLEPWNALPADFRRHFEPQPENGAGPRPAVKPDVNGELVRRALELASSSGRNEGGLWLACQLRDNGRSEVEAEQVMLDYQRSVGPSNHKGEREPYTLEEARASLRSAYSRPAREPWGGNGRPAHAMPTPAVRPLATFPLTDSGNAERFAQMFGDRFRYSQLDRIWYTWTGERWEPDKRGRTLTASLAVCRALYREAAEIEDQKERAAGVGWARATESRSRREAMIGLAVCEGDIPVTPQEWDTDPWLLNCLSGTIDLRTGELRAHSKADKITKLAPVEYDPGAQSEVWERFLRDSTGGDQEFIDFLQRAVGYSLTGETSEEVLFMPIGPGATGKSTFLEAVKAILGDYATTTDFETFTQKRNDGGPRNDIAALAGKRMVVSIEVQEGKRLAENVIKHITGGDTVSARFLYQENFEFKPAFELWLAANDPPNVRHADSAVCRCILRLPFERVVPVERRDPTLKKRLTTMPDYQRAILAWAVEGALRWREEGLMVPMRIVQATEAYRASQNPIADFLTECCERGPDCAVSSGAFYAAYQGWCIATGNDAVRIQRFTEAPKAEGFEKLTTKTGKFWQGVQPRKGDG